jgi:hypothetical protein
MEAATGKTAPMKSPAAKAATAVETSATTPVATTSAMLSLGWD